MKTYWDIQGDAGSDVAGQVASQRERLKARLAGVRFRVAVMSGKGGVGKSLLTANLAAAMAGQGLAVGALDADLNGPTLAAMLGARRQPLAAERDGLRPARGAAGVRVMSMDLLLPGDRTPLAWRHPGGLAEDSFVWRGTLEASALREFLADIHWGELDYLLLDLPPGTDRYTIVARLLDRLDGVVVVGIPSAAAAFVLGRTLAFLEGQGAPVLGLVENMAAYHCQHCGKAGELFPGGRELQDLAQETGLPLLGRVPFDPRLASTTDAGRPLLLEQADTPAAAALRELASRVRERLEGRG